FSAVVVIGTEDLVVSKPVDERVLPLQLNPASQSFRVHANDRYDVVVSIDELLRLDAPFGPSGSPIIKPASNARMSPIYASLVRGVVVVDLGLLIDHAPG